MRQRTIDLESPKIKGQIEALLRDPLFASNLQRFFCKHLETTERLTALGFVGRGLYQALENGDGSPEPFEELRLVYRQPQFNALPWEMMSRPGGPALFAQGVSVIRSLTRDPERRLGEVELPLVVVVQVYAPEDVRPILDYEREEERIQSVLDPFLRAGTVRLYTVEDGTPESLARAIKRYDPHLLYLSGHGGYDAQGGFLAMETSLGAHRRMNVGELKPILRLGRRLHMAIVSSCKTATMEVQNSPALAQSLAAVVPLVIGMLDSVQDESATRFMEHFFAQLMETGNPGMALCAARQKVADDPESALPVLFARNFAGSLFTPSAVGPGPLGESTDLRDPEESAGRGFVGRRRELITIMREIAQGERAFLLVGPGGVGKSTLARRLAQRMDLTSLISFQGVVSVVDILEKLRDHLQAHPASDPRYRAILAIVQNSQNPLLTRLALAGHLLKLCPAALIFDDWEENLEAREGEWGWKSAELAQAMELLARNMELQPQCWQNTPFALPPAQKPALLLITCRYPLVPSGFQLHHLKDLALADAVKKMNRSPFLHGLPWPEKKEVHRKLGGNPRSLNLLSSFLANCGERWQKLEQDRLWDKALEALPQEVRNELGNWESLEPKQRWDQAQARFPAVLEEMVQNQITRDLLAHLQEVEYCLFRRWAVYEEPVSYNGLFVQTREHLGIPENDLGQEERRAQVETVTSSVLERLLSFSLVEKEPHLGAAPSAPEAERTLYQVPRTTAFLLGGEPALGQSAHRVAGDFYWRVAENRKSVGEALIARGHYRQGEAWDRARALTFSAGNSLQSHGYWQLALEIYEETREDALSHPCPEQEKAAIFNALGLLYDSLGEKVKAEDYYLQALPILKAIGGREGEATALVNLGALYWKSGEKQKARKSLEQSLSLWTELDLHDRARQVREILARLK